VSSQFAILADVSTIRRGVLRSAICGLLLKSSGRSSDFPRVSSVPDDEPFLEASRAPKHWRMYPLAALGRIVGGGRREVVILAIGLLRDCRG
jgi:hypothetical protein